jgi:predicted tellurium resistance membrane protein TerC
MIENLLTLALLTLLQAVLGFDNLLYISLESKRAPADKQAMVRKWGIAIAIGLRILLLFVLVNVIQFFQDPFFSFGFLRIQAAFSIHSLIVLAGGGFIVYTAMKEIVHMMSLEQDDDQPQKTRSVGQTIAWIVLMNLVFSFDSILSAIALTNVFWVMAAAIVFSGLMMIQLADRVSSFLQKNRMVEVLGLFVLFVVGIMLLTEGGHLAELDLFGYRITPMSKATFYFVIFVLVVTDIVQSRYQRKIFALKEAAERREDAAAS